MPGEVVAALGGVGLAEYRMGPSEVATAERRIAGEGSLGGEDGVVQTTGADEERGEVGVGKGEIGIEVDGGGEVAGGLGRAVFAKEGIAEIAVGDGTIGIEIEHALPEAEGVLPVACVGP